MTKPDGGMFGIKLVTPDHLRYAEFTDVPSKSDESAGRFPLMNFSGEQQQRAANIPIGHRCLVYVTKERQNPNKWGRFIWAIEIRGTLEDGDQALVPWRHPPGQALPGNPPALPAVPPKYSLHWPIRFLARIDPPENGPTPDELRRSDFVFSPNAFTHKYLSAADYHRAFNAIDWTWLAR